MPGAGTVCIAALLAAPIAHAQDFTTLKGHGGPIMGLAVAPSGQVASASFDNSVGLWENEAPTWLEGHTASVGVVHFGDQEAGLLTGGDDFRVLLWNRTTSEPTELARHQGKVSAIDMHAPTGLIATASWDGSIKLIERVDYSGTGNASDAEARVIDLTAHRSNVTDIAFRADGTLFSSSSDGTIRHWSLAETPNSRVILSHGFGINELVATEEWLAYGAVDGGTRIVTHDGAALHDFTLDRRPILAMVHHPESGQLAVGDGEGYIMIIDTAEWRITRDFRAARQGPVWALAFSPDGKTIYAGGLDDVIYAWPVALLDQFDPAIDGKRSFLRDAASMPNGERQFMRKCSICHALEAGPSRKAGPTLFGVFGRKAGTVPGYSYSRTLDESDITWSDQTIDALFDEGPDHYIPGSKMPMQVIAAPEDRADLVAFLKEVTAPD